MIPPGCLVDSESPRAQPWESSTISTKPLPWFRPGAKFWVALKTKDTLPSLKGLLVISLPLAENITGQIGKVIIFLNLSLTQGKKRVLGSFGQRNF